MKKNRVLAIILALGLMLSTLAGCGNVVEQASNPPSDPSNSVPENSQPSDPQEVEDKTDLSEHVDIKINFAVGNKSRTITYNQESPLTMPDGSVITSGMLKPVWSYLQDRLNISITDVALQDQKSAEMISTASTTNFSEAQIFGGGSIASDLMYYGTEGKLVNLSDMMAQGYMPNYKQYLEENPNVKSAITAYDGNIYHVPYIAELNTFARSYLLRTTWVTKLLDTEDAAYDTGSFTTYYDGFYVGDNARTGSNGGSVMPKEGVTITKKTSQSIIEIQNSLATKNGRTLTEALVQYIKDNYDYDNPSELYLGEKAAYDIDELIALLRCVKANPAYLTDGKASVVWPLFMRQSSYREDFLKLGTYFGGIKAHGADTYGARWYIDENGDVQYTYSTEGIYNVLCYLSDMEAEGLLYSDCYDQTNKTNFRTTLWGTDESDAPSFGFMTFDFLASSTADNLNQDINVVLPPVAEINGEWRYHYDNGRAIKPDGWAISVAGCANDAELHRACAVLDYFFSQDGLDLQNYGIPDCWDNGSYVGPDGVTYLKLNSWTLENANNVAHGDIATFLRDWIGAQMPVGYQKNIGFEYQSTSERGFAGWELLQNSTCSFATYAGVDQAGKPLTGTNPNYFKMIPPVFSLTVRQREAISSTTTIEQGELVDSMFNIVLYHAKGNTPSGITIPSSYEEYYQTFVDRNLDAYIQAYQQAYQVMTAGNS